MTQTVLFVGGGSIGHIAPSVAVMQQLQRLKPDVQCHFVCLPSSAETSYLQKNGCTFSTISAPRLSLSFPWKFYKALKQASALLDEVQPSVVFSKGGYVSAPVCLAARRKKIPIVLHESDAVSGYANRMVGRWAQKICTGFPLQKEDALHVHTGNPIREKVTQGNRDEGLQITGFSAGRPMLLVMGGSQGSQALNKAVSDQIMELLDMCNVIHLTGHNKDGAGVQDSRYFRREFVHGELPHLYAISDVAVSRAGANALSELAANNIQTIVVPLRGVGHDHQQKNAEAAAQNGCVLLDQNDLKTSLLQTVKECLHSKNSGSLASQAPKTGSPEEPSIQIAKILSDTVSRYERS